MNNSNPLYQEMLATRHSKTIDTELRQIGLQKEAARAARDGWMAHSIAHFAEWMIATGETLRHRYDHNAMHNRNTRTGALAH